MKKKKKSGNFGYYPEHANFTNTKLKKSRNSTSGLRGHELLNQALQQATLDNKKSLIS